MKRTWTLAGLAAAGAVLFVACSSGTASPSGAPTATSPTLAALPGDSFSESSPPATESPTASSKAPEPPATPTSTVIPANLDSASTNWFDALCSDMVAISAASQQLDMVVANSAQWLTDGRPLDFGVHTPTLGLLATTPPPDFEGGATYASAVTMGLQLVVASMYSDEPQMTAEFATLDPYDSDAVGQFRTKWRGSDLLHPRLWVINQRLDPSIRAAANAIPSCKAAGGL